MRRCFSRLKTSPSSHSLPFFVFCFLTWINYTVEPWAVREEKVLLGERWTRVLTLDGGPVSNHSPDHVVHRLTAKGLETTDHRHSSWTVCNQIDFLDGHFFLYGLLLKERDSANQRIWSNDTEMRYFSLCCPLRHRAWTNEEQATVCVWVREKCVYFPVTFYTQKEMYYFCTFLFFLNFIYDVGALFFCENGHGRCWMVCQVMGRPICFQQSTFNFQRWTIFLGWHFVSRQGFSATL